MPQMMLSCEYVMSSWSARRSNSLQVASSEPVANALPFGKNWKEKMNQTGRQGAKHKPGHTDGPRAGTAQGGGAAGAASDAGLPSPGAGFISPDPPGESKGCGPHGDWPGAAQPRRRVPTHIPSGQAPRVQRHRGVPAGRATQRPHPRKGRGGHRRRAASAGDVQGQHRRGCCPAALAAGSSAKQQQNVESPQRFHVLRRVPRSPTRLTGRQRARPPGTAQTCHSHRWR